MADPTNYGRESPPPESPVQRQRAPTINIDTSAVSPPLAMDNAVPLDTMSGNPQPSQGPLSNELESGSAVPYPQPASSGVRSSQSFDRDSRPVSSHNVSSPTKGPGEAQPNTFLSVPAARSRGNSVDSEDTYTSSPASSTDVDRSHPAPVNHNIINDRDALKPDPGTEADFNVTDNKFAFSPGQLNKLINPKSLAAFHALGGLAGLERGLRTDRHTGLSMDETSLEGSVSFESANAGPANGTHIKPPASARSTGDAFADRKRIFKDNRLPEKKSKSIFELAWMAYKDKVLILLTGAAVISLALGIYQSVSAAEGETAVEWVEGVAIMAAILIVVVVGATNDWQKERQFVKLNKKKEDRSVKVIRSGKPREISVYDVMVGDIMQLEPGDMVPVDGIFIRGDNVKCDESSATGESDLLRKYPGDEVYRAIEAHEDVKKMDPFILSGAKVTEGVGTFLVTSVGVNSSYGKMMMALREDSQTTPLQSKLNILAEYIAKLGLAAGLLLFVVLLIKFLAGLPRNTGTPTQKGQQFLQIFIVAVTVVVVAVPEGLPLAVTLALAFATTRMIKQNNLVRILRACETMGNATTVCSDKTGTLTQNKMTVVAGTLGTAYRFGGKRNAEATTPEQSEKGKELAPDDEAEDTSTVKFVSALHPDVKSLVKQSIVINSTAFEGEQDGKHAFIGSKTDTALLSFAREYFGMGPVNEERANAEVAQFVPFDSGRKCMASVVKLNDRHFRMYVKGASEILLAKCSRIIRDPASGVSETAMTSENLTVLTDVITNYASRSLRTIGLLYRDFEEWPPRGLPTEPDNPQLAVFDKIFNDMIFLGIVGIQDPLREGVTAAVRSCQHAGVFVRMVTGDNILTARAIATECGIFTPGGLVMEGPEFRKLGRAQMDQVIPKLQVLARSSPEDKRILVKRLKELGEIVAVTGDGTNDAPALKTADVGFSMGIAGTEVAKEASAIILMDDNFASIVKAIMWGRAVNDAVKKFLQFQVTVNITAVILTFVSAVSSGDESSVLTAVQLLWVNLIMDTLAALALATDPPTLSILNRKPEPRSAPLITLTMWKMIIGQSIFQLVVTFILYFAGLRIFSYETQRERDQLQTLVFNTFVWMQIFNQYNSRRLDSKFNIFEGIFQNYFFIGIQFIIVAGQVMIVFVGGEAFSVHRLNAAQWGYSIVLGALSIPMAVIIRLIPDELVRQFIPERLRRKRTPEVFVSDEDERFQWNPALVEIREELSFLKTLRGGRLNALRHKLQHPRQTWIERSGSRARGDSVPQTPTGIQDGIISGVGVPPSPDSRSQRRGRSRANSALNPAAAMAGVIAGSIAGWSPVERGHGDEDNVTLNRSNARSELESHPGVTVHPGTDEKDPIIVEDPGASGAAPSQVKETTPKID